MKIYNLDRISEVYNTKNRIKAVEKLKKMDGDKVTFSNQAKDFQLAYKMAKESPDVREEKVAALKQSIQSGTYNVSAEEIAAKMMSQFDFKA